MEVMLTPLRGMCRHREADRVQAVAEAYAERQVFDACTATIAALHGPSTGLVPVLKAVIALYAVYRLRTRLAWFMERGLINRQQAAALRDAEVELSAALGASGVARRLVDGLGVPDGMLRSPIAHVRSTHAPCCLALAVCVCVCAWCRGLRTCASVPLITMTWSRTGSSSTPLTTRASCGANFGHACSGAACT